MKEVYQEIFNGEIAAKQINSGIQKVALVVGHTLGAKGRNVVIDSRPLPIITKDGVTVARSINLKDPVERIGSKLLISVAQSVNEKVGDGTTTATILAAKLYQEGISLKKKGGNPVFIKKGIDYGLQVTLQLLESYKYSIQDEKELFQVAKLSANGDEEIARNLLEAIKIVTSEGVIQIQKSPSILTEIQVTEFTFLTTKKETDLSKSSLPTGSAPDDFIV